MITLHDGDGGLPFISIQNQAGRAKICLLGATVMEYQPAGADPVLWTSPNSRFVVGTPIRGGIPVCWPWFGPHPVNPILAHSPFGAPEGGWASRRGAVVNSFFQEQPMQKHAELTRQRLQQFAGPEGLRGLVYPHRAPVAIQVFAAPGRIP